MWELDQKERWMPKNWCFWTVVLEKTLECLLDWKEIKSVNHKGNQSWIFIGRTDAQAKAPGIWTPDVKNWLIWKDPYAGKDWRQEEKGMTEDEIFGSVTDTMDMGLCWLRELMDREAWRAAIHGVTKSRTLLSDWSDLLFKQSRNNYYIYFIIVSWDPEKPSCYHPIQVALVVKKKKKKKNTCKYRRFKRHGFDLWVKKIPSRRAWQPTPMFLPGESPWTEEPDRL